MMTSDTPPGTPSPRRSLRLALGIGATVLGVTLALPTSASAAAGTSPRSSSLLSASDASATVHVRLEFNGNGGRMAFDGWGDVQLKDPKDKHVFRDITVKHITAGLSRPAVELHLAPGTGINVTFFAHARSHAAPDGVTATDQIATEPDSLDVPSQGLCRRYAFGGSTGRYTDQWVNKSNCKLTP